MHQFWARGYAGTSMEDLVRCMGINRASLYATYGGKRALFLSALRRYDERCRRRRICELEASSSALGAIRGLFEGWIDQVRSGSPILGCLLANTAVELSAEDREAGELVAETQRDTMAFFRRQVERGQALGEIPSGVDPGRTSGILLASLLGLLVLVRSGAQLTVLQSIVDQAVSFADRPQQDDRESRVALGSGRGGARR